MSGKQLRKKSEIRALYKSSAALRNEIDLIFLLQDWDDGYNVGGMFRVADAAGASMLLLTGKTPEPGAHPTIGVTSMGAHRRIPWKHFARHDDAIQWARDTGYQLVAVEVADNSIYYREFSYPDKTCLVLGNEAKGIYSNVLKQCDTSVHIPMSGKGRSLNVHVAAAVVGFEATLQRGSFEPIEPTSGSEPE